jgi:hypothetical protein
MRPVEHFLSLLDRLEQTGDSGGASANGFSVAGNRESEGTEDRLVREFVRLAAPVIGAAAAEDLCAAALDRLKAKGSREYRKIGFIAAFLLEDFDDDSMELDDEDWEDIRETLEDVSGGMSLETLTNLMDELLSRGKLG